MIRLWLWLTARPTLIQTSEERARLLGSIKHPCCSARIIRNA